ncbi:MAG TPA: hypothetical protein DDZ51_20775 [Planctomycetaceae bacterium]|nr:hypothetical protein [Planctomycetaceae bacterium]
MRYYAARFGVVAVQFELDDTDGPFNKSRLINRAVAQWRAYGELGGICGGGGLICRVGFRCDAAN